MLDVNGRSLSVDDQIYYATTHGVLQKGRIISVTKEGWLKVKGVGNKRELTIKDSSIQILLWVKKYYVRNPKLNA